MLSLVSRNKINHLISLSSLCFIKIWLLQHFVPLFPPYCINMHLTKSKATEQCFYCYSISQSHRFSYDLDWWFYFQLVRLQKLFSFKIMMFLSFTDEFLMDCKTTCAINVILLIRLKFPKNIVTKVWHYKMFWQDS